MNAWLPQASVGSRDPTPHVSVRSAEWADKVETSKRASGPDCGTLYHIETREYVVILKSMTFASQNVHVYTTCMCIPDMFAHLPMLVAEAMQWYCVGPAL